MEITVFNLFKDTPPNAPDWPNQAPVWEKLGREVGASSDFRPLTIKALYVAGIILADCRSIDVLLHSKELVSTVYFPAYIVFASAVELLGRCIRGNDKDFDSTKDLQAGFRWLAQPDINSYAAVPLDHSLVTTTTSWGTPIHAYTIRELAAMRHFVAHGQAAAGNLPEFDYGVLGHMPPVLAIGIQEYLKACESSLEPCSYLAKARIVPYRNRPVFDSIWQFQVQTGLFPISVGNTLRRLGWAYDPKYILECSAA